MIEKVARLYLVKNELHLHDELMVQYKGRLPIQVSIHFLSLPTHANIFGKLESIK